MQNLLDLPSPDNPRKRGSGNKCGHEPDHPRLRLRWRPPKHSIVQDVAKRAREFYWRPSRIEPLSGGPTERETRTERREALALVIQAVIARTDFLTGWVVCPDPRDGGVIGVDRERLATETGLSVSRVDRALSDLKYSRFLASRPTVEALPRRRWRGHAARREVTGFLWAALGMTVTIDLYRKHAAKDARRAAHSEQIAADMRGRAGRRKLRNVAREARLLGRVGAGVASAPRVDSDPEYHREYSNAAHRIRTEQPDLPGPEVRRQADAVVRSRWRGPPLPPFVPTE